MKGALIPLSILSKLLGSVLHVPDSALAHNPHLMLSKHNIDRIVSVASHPDRAQYQTRLGVHYVHDFSASSKHKPVGADPDNIVKVLDRTIEQSTVI